MTYQGLIFLISNIHHFFFCSLTTYQSISKGEEQLKKTKMEVTQPVKMVVTLITTTTHPHPPPLRVQAKTKPKRAVTLAGRKRRNSRNRRGLKRLEQRGSVCSRRDWMASCLISGQKYQENLVSINDITFSYFF